MTTIRGVFRVKGVNKFQGETRVGAFLRLESTRASAALFGAQLHFLTVDSTVIEEMDLGAEVLLEVSVLRPENKAIAQL